MIEIDRGLYVGAITELDKFSLMDDAIVPATQTIHYKIMGWDRKYNKPPKDHSNYNIWEKENRLSLNWVDGAAYLCKWSGPEIFIRVLDFVDKWIPSKKVFIHCDQGFSRRSRVGWQPTLPTVFCG